ESNFQTSSSLSRAAWAPRRGRSNSLTQNTGLPAIRVPRGGRPGLPGPVPRRLILVAEAFPHLKTKAHSRRFRGRPRPPILPLWSAGSPARQLGRVLRAETRAFAVGLGQCVGEPHNAAGIGAVRQAPCVAELVNRLRRRAFSE